MPEALISSNSSGPTGRHKVTVCDIRIRATWLSERSSDGAKRNPGPAVRLSTGARLRLCLGLRHRLRGWLRLEFIDRGRRHDAEIGSPRLAGARIVDRDRDHAAVALEDLRERRALVLDHGVERP